MSSPQRDPLFFLKCTTCFPLNSFISLLPVCRILEAQEVSFILYSFFSLQSKLAVFLLIYHSQKAGESPIYVMGTHTIGQDGHPQIFLRVPHLYSRLLLKWLSVSMNCLPNLFWLSSHTLAFSPKQLLIVTLIILSSFEIWMG